MGAPPVARLRVAARLANGFALDLVKLGGFGRDVVDGLMLAAISQANVAEIARSPELQLRYATLDAPPPDELRRPVSINALAASLRIPFETARRRISALADAEVVKIGPRGVILPQGPLNSPFYRVAAQANYELVRRLYGRLLGIGMFQDLARAPSPFDPADPPVRLVIRCSSDYLLRLAEPVTENVGDLVAGLILMDVIQANTEHLPDVEEPADITPQGYVKDEARRPVRAAAVGRRLGIPQETVRRHLNRMVSEGRLERVADGYVATGRILMGDAYLRYIHDNQVNVQRLVHTLAETGVLALWDTEAEALRGPYDRSTDRARPQIG